MNHLPSGTVTFLFTDVEGSTRYWEQDPAGMRVALERHDAALSRAVAEHGGVLFKKTGDGIFAAFADASRAVAAALAAQREIISWTADLLPVRMAVYAGPAQESDGDYVGPTLNRTARMLATGHGGQILISQTSRDLVLDSLPEGASLIDLGQHHLKDLERPEQIYQLHHPDLRSEFPPLRSLAAFRHNLPIQLTSLIGRQEEVRTVRDLVKSHRLVTLYGSGGCGKTRLALQVGAEVVDSFPDGVWLVELSNAADSVQAEQALVSVLGLREEGGRDTGQVIMEHLREREALLILDNCEHLVEACAAQAQILLQTCANIKVLTTSREVLGVRGEVTYRVPSLPVPDSIRNVTDSDLSNLRTADSVRLFTERAEEAAPGFALVSSNAAHVVEVTRRVDGIPLAIELAAARVRTLTVEQISERLRDHFSLLRTTGPVPARQATLRATMDWSYLLLGPQERALLARLTVFAGGWTLESAEAVCVAGIRGRTQAEPFEAEDVADLLSRLEDKSLIAVDRTTDSARYRMLQMVREYASEHLAEAESDSIERRHLEYFLGIAEEAEANLNGPRQGDWLKRLDTDHDNLRAALDFAKRNSESSESGLRLAGSLARYWHTRGFLSEGRRQLSSVIGLSGDVTISRGWGLACNGGGVLAWAQADYDSACTLYEEGLRIWRALADEFRIAGALSNLGLVCIDIADFPRAKDLLDESLSIRQRIGDIAGTATSLGNLGLWAGRQKDYDASRAYNEASLNLRRQMGDETGVAISLSNLGVIAREFSRYDDARNLWAESLTLFDRLGDKARRAYVLLNLGELAHLEGDSQSAEEWYRWSLAEFEALGDASGTIIARQRFTAHCPSSGADSRSTKGVVSSPPELN